MTAQVEDKRTVLIHPRINMQVKNPESIEGMTRDKDREVVGTFINVECPGQTAKVCAKLYKGMEYFSKVFEDGEKCSIPLSVARFINERCQHFKHGYLMDEKGLPIKSEKATSRYKFMIESFA